MTEIAFIFPGQGSQQVGMGLKLAQNYEKARAVFDTADTFLCRQLSQLCFEGPESELKQTENTQLAILTCSVATLNVLTELSISPKVVAGHSLGEYSALVASGALDFSDALQLVSARAQFMAEAGEEQNGTMAAILGMEIEQLQSICERVQGVVKIANYNCPGQLVISGEIDAVNKVVALAADRIGARRCRLLAVSGAFHSPLMESAQQKFQNVINAVPFHQPKVDIAMNVTGKLATDTELMKHLLFKQITQPIQWEKSLRTIHEIGIKHFVEVGPGKVLSGLVKRTLPESSTFNVEDVESLSIVTDEFANGK